MNFKQPRCSSTPHNFVSVRAPSSGELCGVGSGECKELAIDVADGGSVDCQLPVCAAHKDEFIALSRLVNEMTPNQIRRFSDAIG